MSYPAVQAKWDAIALQMNSSAATAGIVAKLANLTGFHLSPGTILDYCQDNIICARSHNLALDPYLNANYALIKNFTQSMKWEEYRFVPSDPRGPIGGPLVRQIVQNFQPATPPNAVYISLCVRVLPASRWP